MAAARPAAPGGRAAGAAEFTCLDAALAWLDAERANLIPAVRLVEAHPEALGQAASDAVSTLRAYLDIRALSQELDCLSRWLLALARKPGHPVAAAMVHRTLGVLASKPASASGQTVICTVPFRPSPGRAP